MQSPIARSFYLALTFIQHHIAHNWGWAILVLTLAINLALLPTRLYANRSQLKLRRIQPRIDVIRARFKGVKFGDPRMEQMNREIFDLQRSEGVSIFSGMLPLLVQTPLLYGFYQMLRNASELRHAPWLWLHDLSAADPLHILPVVFVVTMIALQLLTPAPGVEPAQRKTMTFLFSIFGGIMSWNVAAGLALYWTFGNVINIAHQLVLSKSRLS